MAKPGNSLLRNARREAVTALVVVGLALAWTVGVSYLLGYRHAPDDWVVRWGLATVRTPRDWQQIAGMPDWVFLGVLLPWLLSTVFTLGACLGFKDDDLGEDAEDANAAAANLEEAGRGH